MTYDANEKSVEDSQPREGYEFVLPAVTYRLASGVKDVMINGQTYRAGTIQRAEAVVGTAIGSTGELEVALDVAHALPQRFLRGGIPPRSITVNVYRKQLTSGEYRQIWSGRMTGMKCEGHVAKVHAVQYMENGLQRRIPTITVGKDCSHILYDDNCRVNRAGNTIATSLTAVNGRVVSVASVGGNPNQWFRYGELLHVASGERMTIADQTGMQITMQLPILDAKLGDAVQIVTGCDRSIATCFDKFANHYNFGGFPQLPTRNPFVSNGFGVVEQS